MAKNSTIAALSYILIGIIWYFSQQPKSPLLKHHVKQAINLWIIGLVIFALLNVIAPLLTFITFGFGAIIFIPLFILVRVLFLVLGIIGIINAINFNKKPLPLIGKFAPKYLTF